MRQAALSIKCFIAFVKGPQSFQAEIAADQASSHEEREKTDLIIELENSGSFAGTHSVIAKLLEIKNRTDEQKEALFEIALRNSQVHYILGDSDVSRFYQRLLKDVNNLSETAQKIKEVLEPVHKRAL